MKEKKDVRLVTRITAQLKQRLEDAAEKVGVPEPVVVVRCLEAYCDYVEEHGEATFPLIVKPRSAEIDARVPKRKTA